jgi:uncharacterized protein
MDVLIYSEIDTIVNNSNLIAKYNQVNDGPSAYEILTSKLQHAATNTAANAKTTKAGGNPEERTFEKIADNTVVKSMMRTAANSIVRSLLGSLGLVGRSISSSKSWF